MANPDGERTTIVNVKAVRVEAWERGKAAANRAGESMGSWLSRAVDQLANLEAGERYIPPGERTTPAANLPANPAPVVDMHQLAAVVMAMGQAGVPVQKRVAGKINAVLYGALGGPVRRQISGGKAETENGKAGEVVADPRSSAQSG